jgi:hypothetical protein
MRSLVFLSGLSAVMASRTWAAALGGTAWDTTGHQIQNALVIVRSANSGTEVARSRTTASGAYSFSSLPTGVFSIAISAAGFMTTTVRDVRLNDQEKSMRPVMLELGYGCGSIPVPQFLRALEGADDIGRISGTVADHTNNRPIANADIKLICESNRSCAETTSDASGHYVFSREAGAYSLRIQRSGYFEDEYRTYHVQAGFETVYYPIFLDRCQSGKCQPARKPIPRCE